MRDLSRNHAGGLGIIVAPMKPGAVGWLYLAALASGIGCASTAGQPLSAAQRESAHTELERRLAEAQRALEEVVPWRLRRRPALRIVSREDPIETTCRIRRRIEGTELVWTTLGLPASPDSTLVRRYLQQRRASGYSTGGCYSTEEHAIFLFGEDAADLPRDVLIHELQHAIRHERFADLGGASDNLSWDSYLAREFLVEGEASYVELVVRARRSALSTETEAFDLDALVRTQSLFSLERVAPFDSKDVSKAGDDMPPRHLLRILTAPYVVGVRGLHRLRSTDGWDGIDRMYASIPGSTAVFLDPEAPLRQQPPGERVRLLPLRAMPAGWSLVEENTLGQYLLRVVLTEQVPADLQDQAVDAATGWTGDRFAVFTAPGAARPVLVLATRWASARDASRFASSYRFLAGSRNVRRGWPAAIVRAAGATAVVVEGAAPELAEALLDEASPRAPDVSRGADQ